MAPRPLIAAVAVASSLFVAAPAQADTFVVNTTSDSVGAAGCPSVCTIRGAIGAAAGNGNAVDDVIEVPAGTYTLNPQLGTLTVPPSATRITIQGAGANTTVIQPNVEIAMRLLSVGTNAGLALRDVTLRNGRVIATNGIGGNILAQDGAALTLFRVRVNNGNAPRGGGIGITAGGSTSSLLIGASLIDGNSATTTGGGISIEGSTADVAATITDSTLTQNTANNGGAIGVINNSGTDPALRGVTMTRNRARTTGIGGIYSASTSARFQGSIVGGNTMTFTTGSGTIQVPANCGLNPASIDEGGNVSFDADDPCGLGGVHTDPQLAAALDGSQPPVLTIPANSSAVDIAACSGRTFDQRGVLRPQGLTCDAGAYEYQPPAIDPTPTPTPTPPTPSTPTASPTPTATATPVPTPVVNLTVVVETAKGTVLVRLPRTNRFVRLGAADDIPVGSTVDTRDGEVFLTAIPRAGAPPERAKFWDGIFKVSQSRGITTLTLTEALAPCASRRARAAQTKKPKTRRLWGDGKGKFRTKGRYSAATVRGTRWLVTDGCRFTRTRVTVGAVTVTDGRKRVVVRRGRSYTARPGG